MKRQIKHSNLSRLALLAFAMIVLTVSTRALIAQQDSPPESIEIRNLWLDEITCATIPPTFVVNDSYISLWMESIQHSEVDLKQELVATLEKIHTLGVDQTAIAEKIRGLLSSDNHHTFNMALASLLVALDDQQSAKQLFELLKPGRIELSQVIEPALANWKFEPIKSVWKDRLKERKIRRTHLTLAIRGLGDIRDKSSVELLKGFVMDRSQPATIRVAAAKAVGNICENGLTSDAKQLTQRPGSKGIVDRLCGVAMLVRHQTDSSNQLLQHLLLDEEGAVAGAAWQQLLAIDSSLAVPSALACHENPDPLVRRHVVTSLFEQPNIERMSLLGKMLADHHPEVRILARLSLFKLASQSEDFDAQARSVGMEIIDDQGSGFRELEQALVLLAGLDHKPVASRALDLLGHQHPKVMVATAWALRILQVEETFPAMLDRASKISKILMANQMDHPLHSSVHMDQVAHLFDSFGVSEYKPAESLMRTFIPKNLDLFNNCRPAAIAAVGKLNKGNPEPALVQLLIQRMNDQILDPPESDELCATCAIALGRMGAKSALGDIQQYYEGTPPISGLNYAAAWSIRELTGKDFPDPASPIMKRTGFNLEPGFARIQDAGGDEDIGSGFDDQ